MANTIVMNIGMISLFFFILIAFSLFSLIAYLLRYQTKPQKRGKRNGDFVNFSDLIERVIFSSYVRKCEKSPSYLLYI